MKIFFLLTFLSIFHCSFADEKFSEAFTAQVFYSKGIVEIAEEGSTEFIAIEKGDDLNIGDTLRTGESSLAILMLPDHSKVKLGPSTEILVERLVERVQGESFERSSFILKAGRVLIDVINKGSEPVLDLKADNISLGVRGTRFFAGKGGAGDLWVSVDSGEIEVRDINNKNRADAIDAGEGIVIEGGSEFTQPKEYNWVKSINYQTDSNAAINDGFSDNREQRRREFREKREKWQRNEGRWQKRIARWKTMRGKYEQKAKQFKEIRQKMQQRRKQFLQKREEFKNRKRNLIKRYKQVQKEKRKLQEAVSRARSRRGNPRQKMALNRQRKAIQTQMQAIKKEKEKLEEFRNKMQAHQRKFSQQVERLQGKQREIRQRGNMLKREGRRMQKQMRKRPRPPKN